MLVVKTPAAVGVYIGNDQGKIVALALDATVNAGCLEALGGNNAAGNDVHTYSIPTLRPDCAHRSARRFRQSRTSGSYFEWPAPPRPLTRLSIADTTMMRFVRGSMLRDRYGSNSYRKRAWSLGIVPARIFRRTTRRDSSPRRVRKAAVTPPQSPVGKRGICGCQYAARNGNQMRRECQRDRLPGNLRERLLNLRRVAMDCRRRRRASYFH